jgi:predicted  nucleic acid-binding Zn ribbon protein
MQSLGSQLSKQGLVICRKIEELTNIPTYYYIYNYKKYKGGDSISRSCPSCKGEWGLENPLHDFYDFQCNRCKLLSNLSRNT